MADKRNPAAGGSGASGRVSFHHGKNIPKIATATTLCKPREALLDACWHASTVHAAARTASILTYIIDHLRQHAEFDRFGLGPTVDRLVALRERHPSDGPLHVGRAALGQAIDEIVAAVANPTANNFMSFPLKGRDDAAPCGAAKPRSTAP
jgi:hypothetical protein